MDKIPLKDQITTVVKNDLTFLHRFILNPAQIGSITPSSHYLVRKMLSTPDWSRVRNVAELGAGTGVLTEELVKRLSSIGKLSVFELDTELREKIEQRLQVHVYTDARQLSDLVSPHSLDLVISSLPWTTLSPDVRLKILRGILMSLKPDGQFVAYQYSLHMLKCFRSLFKSVSVSFVLANLPPAFVYDCDSLREDVSLSDLEAISSLSTGHEDRK